MAVKARLQIQAGVDPADAKAATKEQAAKTPDTIATVVEAYIRLDLERRKRSPRHIGETRNIFSNHVLPRWADRNIKSIIRRDVIELLDEVMDTGTVVKAVHGKRKKLRGGPIIANRTLAAIRALFNWALRRGIIDATPAALVRAPGEEKRRERTLVAEEVRTVWGAAAELSYPFGPFFQLLLLTGQRREEVARIRWADLDLDERIWTLPSTATKAARTHVVPLAPMAVELLGHLPRIGTTHVFTTTGATPISGFSKAKSRLDRSIAEARGKALAPWAIHDMRRTAATEMGRLGVSRFLIGRVLNHADRTVTAVYDRHLYLAEKRHALEIWARYLDSLVRPQALNVVTLHAG